MTLQSRRLRRRRRILATCAAAGLAVAGCAAAVLAAYLPYENFDERGAVAASPTGTAAVLSAIAVPVAAILTLAVRAVARSLGQAWRPLPAVIACTLFSVALTAGGALAGNTTFGQATERAATACSAEEHAELRELGAPVIGGLAGMGLRDRSCVAQLSFAADSNAELARLRTRLSDRGWQRGESGGGESHYAKGASILVVDLGAPVTLRFPPG